MKEGPKEHCGVFGIFNHKNAAELTYLAIYSLQHRGQESAGIAVSDGYRTDVVKDMGLVSDVFDGEVLGGLSGKNAIGHVRYSTTGSSDVKNAQPFFVEYFGGSIAIAHNGNFVNTHNLRSKLEVSGSIFQTTIDTELIAHLIAKSKEKKFKDKIVNSLSKVKGAYAVVLLNEDKLIAAKDPNGFRPLCLGKVDNKYCVASESCAFDLIKGQYIREIEPGEILIIDKNGVESIKPFTETKSSFCIFEFIYFSRPDSSIFGGSVYDTRVKLGKQLARECPAKADYVIPVPDSGNYAAMGYAVESGIPFEMGIVRNHYIGRTFIQPIQRQRDAEVRIKLNPIKEVFKGKRVIIIEDSIVRGTTSRARVKTLRDAGAKEIHLRVSCPPHKYPCFYGIDFPSKKELIASSNTVEEIREYLGLDSLGYLSIEGMLKAMPLPASAFCTACFNGKYPVPVKDAVRNGVLDKKRLEKTKKGKNQGALRESL